MDIKFPNPFGTAGGLDKTAKDLSTWTKYKAGFLEVGTFTPEPQGPNPGKIIDRDTKLNALWNCMGFPNPGFQDVLPRIKKFKTKNPDHPPLFINIGKNRNTPFEDSSKDYIKGLKAFHDVADFFVINISSPNTKDLRLLHLKENFTSFVKPIVEYIKENKTPPVLIKLSPDLDDKSFSNFITDSLDLPFAGYTLTNTTTHRPEGCHFPKKGGLSGAPLCTESKSKLKIAKKVLQSHSSKKILISVGGVMTPEEALDRISLGADLVQFYSGLVLSGPSLIERSSLLLTEQVKSRT